MTPQRKAFAFSIIAREKRIATTDLSRTLQLSAEERLRSYVDNLDKNHLITKGGATKGAYYQVNPTLLANAKSNIVTTLKTIEPYVLKALIKEDLHSHPMSKISEIASRIVSVSTSIADTLTSLNKLSSSLNKPSASLSMRLTQTGNKITT